MGSATQPEPVTRPPCNPAARRLYAQLAARHRDPVRAPPDRELPGLPADVTALNIAFGFGPRVTNMPVTVRF